MSLVLPGFFGFVSGTLFRNLVCYILCLAGHSQSCSCMQSQAKQGQRKKPTKQTNKQMDFHPFFWKYSSIEGKRRLLSIRILAPSGFYCCQLLLSQWDCLRARAKENERKKTKVIKLYTLSEC